MVMIIRTDQMKDVTQNVTDSPMRPAAEDGLSSGEVPKRGLADADGKKHPVIEIFGPTIQGEGHVLGAVTSFVRFGGCDYLCKMCDSLHAVIPKLVKQNATYMNAGQIYREVMRIQTPMVTFSGGNPVMHDLDELVNMLASEFYNGGPRIAVETQGSLWRDWLLKCKWVTVSPKGPGMGEVFEPDKFKNFITQLRYAPTPKMGSYNPQNRDWSVKVVILGQDDIEFAKLLLSHYPEISSRFYLSLGNNQPPIPEGPDSTYEMRQNHKLDLLYSYRTLVEKILLEPELRGCRITPQMHVLLWGNKLGV